MFDFSFGELTVCLLVALIVLGPEKLHGVIRSVGRWSGQAKVYMRNLTAELERETHAAEIKRQLQDTHRMLREQTDELQAGVGSIHKDVKDATAQSGSTMPTEDAVIASSSDKDHRGE